jgi:hypothetical protein
MNSPQELLALADEYEAGLKKCASSGYEEYGADFQKRHRMVIDALRASAQPDSISTPELLEMLIKRLQWDGSESVLNSITIGEIRRAV